MMSTESRRTRAEIAAGTRDAILNAACEIIGEEGFEKIRMRMVAERAGVSTAALHYHFDNREKLFAEALRYSFEHTGRDVYQTPSENDTATKRLARIITASLPTTESCARCSSMATARASGSRLARWPSNCTERSRAGSRRHSPTASRRGSSRSAT